MPAVPRGRGPVDEKVIQERFQEFKSSFERRPYQRQKSALEQQLSTFLASVSPLKQFHLVRETTLLSFSFIKIRQGEQSFMSPHVPEKLAPAPAV